MLNEHVKWSVGLSLGLALFLTSDVGRAGEKISAQLVVQDALTTPGKPVTLEATLRRQGMLTQPGVGGEVIQFAVGGKEVGTALTGGDGVARLEYTPRMRGSLPIKARLVESPRVVDREAAATLFSWERRRPVLLIEVASLVRPSPPPGLPLPGLPSVGSSEELTPETAAAEELKRLTEFYYNPIYITGSKTKAFGEPEDLRAWLHEHGFPHGPALMLKPGAAALKAAVEELRKQGWDNVKAGIARSADFASTLVDLRIPVVLVDPARKDRPPRKAQVVESWKDVRKKL